MSKCKGIRTDHKPPFIELSCQKHIAKMLAIQCELMAFWVPFKVQPNELQTAYKKDERSYLTSQIVLGFFHIKILVNYR